MTKEQKTEKKEETIRVLKITNPLYLGNLGPRIQNYVKKLDILGITYETMYSYFVDTIQRWGNIREFWVAYKNNEPAGFAHWFVLGPPHIGKTMMDEFHSWSKDIKIAEKLLDEWEAFGAKHNCPLYETSVINKTILRYAKMRAQKRNYKLIESERTHFVMRR